MDIERILAITLFLGSGTVFLLAISPIDRAIAERLLAQHRDAARLGPPGS